MCNSQEGKTMKKKINITVDDTLLKEVDKLAEQMHISRSGLISVSLADYMDKRTVMQMLPDLMKAYESEMAAEMQ